MSLSPQFKSHYDSLINEAREKEAKIRHEKKMHDYDEATPVLYRGKTLSDVLIYAEGDEALRQTKVKNNIERYLVRFEHCLSMGTNLIFRGTPGLGKTLLSYVIARDLLSKGYSVMYRLCDDLLEEFKDTKTDIEIYRQPDLLIIDETNLTGKITSFKERLFRIIDERYKWQRPILLITNDPQDIFQQNLGEKMCGRLIERGLMLHFDWVSFRTKKLRTK
jgi:DNA replication protein DnaC